MLEILYRLRVPFVLAALALLTGATLLADRRHDPRDPGGDPWWSGALIEITAPVQKTLSMPLAWMRGQYSRYVDLFELRSENELLRTRIASLEEENLQYREALVAGGRLERIVALRVDFESPLQPAEVVGQDVASWFRSVLIDRGLMHPERCSSSTVRVLWTGSSSEAAPAASCGAPDRVGSSSSSSFAATTSASETW
jgi:rod shape-determining protein MreC